VTKLSIWKYFCIVYTACAVVRAQHVAITACDWFSKFSSHSKNTSDLWHVSTYIGNRAWSTEMKHKNGRALFSTWGEIRLCSQGNISLINSLWVAISRAVNDNTNSVTNISNSIVAGQLDISRPLNNNLTL
jgi:hypothetical protein